jgi:hypothetical protein
MLLLCKKLDDMLVYTQKLKADHEERELLHGSRGSGVQILSMELLVTFFCDFFGLLNKHKRTTMVESFARSNGVASTNEAKPSQFYHHDGINNGAVK